MKHRREVTLGATISACLLFVVMFVRGVSEGSITSALPLDSDICSLAEHVQIESLHGGAFAPLNHLGLGCDALFATFTTQALHFYPELAFVFQAHDGQRVLVSVVHTLQGGAQSQYLALYSVETETSTLKLVDATYLGAGELVSGGRWASGLLCLSYKALVEQEASDKPLTQCFKVFHNMLLPSGPL